MDSADYRQVASVSLVVMGLVTLLGFVSAASLYPGYSVADQTISAMGAADAPAASSTVFNSAMVVAGLLTLVAAVGLYRATERRLLTVVVALTGVGGFVGVGLFPSQTGLPHLVAALIALVGAGVSALIVAAGVRGPLRYLSAILGGSRTRRARALHDARSRQPARRRWPGALGGLLRADLGHRLRRRSAGI